MAIEALDVRGIDAYYGDSHVLHAVSFALEGGRLLGLLGRNGAGKTTCMAAIMGFLKPRRGSISLYGENVAPKVSKTLRDEAAGRQFLEREYTAIVAIRDPSVVQIHDYGLLASRCRRGDFAGDSGSVSASTAAVVRAMIASERRLNA